MSKHISLSRLLTRVMHLRPSIVLIVYFSSIREVYMSLDQTVLHVWYQSPLCTATSKAFQTHIRQFVTVTGVVDAHLQASGAEPHIFVPCRRCNSVQMKFCPCAYPTSCGHASPKISCIKFQFIVSQPTSVANQSTTVIGRAEASQ